MDELFRFVTLRPAKPADNATSVPSQASPDLVAVIRDAGSVQERLRELQNRPVHGTLADYRFGAPMSAFGVWATSTAVLDRMTAQRKLTELTGQAAGALAGSQDFGVDLRTLDDSLLVVKYRSAAGDADVTGLTMARIGYDLVEQLAADQQPRLRNVVLVLPAPAAPPPAPVPEPPPVPPDDIAQQLAKIAQARSALRNAIRVGLAPIPQPGLAARAGAEDAEAPVVGRDAAGQVAQVSRAGGVISPWHLPEASVRQMPPEVVATITEIGGDPIGTPAPALSSRLVDAQAELLRIQAERTYEQPQQLRQIGSNWYSQEIQVSQFGSGELIGQPGSVRPVGVGDLLIVRENIKRYESGEVGHIENVLRTEKMSRDTRRLDRTEQTDTTEVTTDKEEERDTQSTDRFSLKRETDSTVKTDAQLKAGLSVDAKYGPMVEVKADLQGSYQHQTEDVTKQTTEYSKDVVSRSVSKLSTKVRQLQTTITLQEFEEKYGHSFDNSAPGGHNVSGVYQFVDKISEAQVYNYGKRLLFDVMVPEPAAFYIWAQQRSTAASIPVDMPPALTVTPSGLNAGNYQIYAQAYGATGIDPPPDEHRTISQSWDATVAADPHLFSKSGTINIDDGYAALQAAASGWWDYNTDHTPQVSVLAGGQSLDLSGGGPNPIGLSAEQGTLPVGLFAAHINATVVTMEVLCESTNRAFQVWQEKAYATIAQAYQQRLSDYQKALAELQAAQAVAVTGRNPGANQAVIAAELRKSCIEQLTTQHFDAFGAIGADAQGRPETDLGRLAVQGPFERFFEEAFEWERIVYFFYPYYWADKQTWAQRSLYDDSDDPVFADFLRAGGARVVFPVRPGFESAIVHYLETGLIWDGGDPPDISSSLYLPIVQEVAEAEQRPGDEVPVGDPWDVRVPTELVKLRPDDTLPVWKKVGQDWVPAN
jgi:hypothetical protein